MKAIVVDQLELRYGSRQALSGASFSVEAGQVFGLLGPNGAGKTSVLRVLVGLRRPHAGRAWILGHDVTTEPRSVRGFIGYVPQAVSADGSLTGRENASLFARLNGLRARRRRERVEDVLHMMGLAAAADDTVATYSGGMVRRLEVACALVGRPRVLLLDEPTLGLDPAARGALWEHIHGQRADQRMSVLVTTHYMEEAEEHCDRVAVMSAGQVVTEGSPGQLRAALAPEASLQDVFIALTASLGDEGRGGFREAGRTRRAARRLG